MTLTSESKQSTSYFSQLTVYYALLDEENCSTAEYLLAEMVEVHVKNCEK